MPADQKIIDAVEEISAKYVSERTGFIFNVLSELMARYRYIPSEALEDLSKRADVPLSVLKRICERSDTFSTDPVGNHLILVCDGTVCHNKRAVELLQTLKYLLHIEPGETTEDNRFTLRTVTCVGSCSEAPVILIDGNEYCRVRLTELTNMLEHMR